MTDFKILQKDLEFYGRIKFAIIKNVLYIDRKNTQKSHFLWLLEDNLIKHKDFAEFKIVFIDSIKGYYFQKNLYFFKRTYSYNEEIIKTFLKFLPLITVELSLTFDTRINAGNKLKNHVNFLGTLKDFIDFEN